MVTHLEETGAWSTCAQPGTCTLPFHLPDVDPLAASQMPQEMLLTIVNVIDPPGYVGPDGEQWFDGFHELHRGYDLPAVVGRDGLRAWFQHGQLHRDNNLPALIRRDGSCEWYVNGSMVRSA